MMHAAVKPARKRKDLRKKSFRTNDIIKLVQEVIRTDVDDTVELAKQFPPTEQGLRALFNLVDDRFRYEEDPAGSQWVQTPSYLWENGVGDCKSYTVFISSVLQNMGLSHLIRYVGYGTSQYRHVYPVALLNGKEIALDVVWKKQEGGRFGQEKPFSKKKDFRMEGLYKLGNTQQLFSEEAIIGQLQNDLNEIETVAAQIPDEVNTGMGDVTQMSAGELDRLIWADRYRVLAGVTPHGGKKGQYLDAALAMEQGTIAGIGSLRNDPFGREVEQILARSVQNTKPAFAPFKIQIPNPVPPNLAGLFKKIGNFIKKVGNAIGNAFKKFVNWIFKGTGKKMGPFYIFKFLNRNKVKSPKIKGRLVAQDKSYEFIRRLGKFDDKQLKGIMLNGIIEQTGKSPAQMAADGGVPQLGSAIVATVIKAISFVVQVVQKIAGLFKRRSSDAGRIDQNTMSDPTLFEEEARLHAAGAPGEGGGFNPILLSALAIPFIL